VKGKNWKHY